MSSLVGRLFNELPLSFISGHSQNYNLTGNLLFNDNTLPDIGAKINFFIRGKYSFFNQFVGSAVTAQAGQFNHTFSWCPSLLSSQQILTLEVVDRSRIFSRKFNFNGFVQEHVVQTLSLPSRKLTAKNDLGNIKVTYNDVNHDPSNINPPAPNDRPDFGYAVRFIKAAGPEFLKDFFVKGLSAVQSVTGVSLIDTARVQSIYNSFGPQFPSSAATFENLIEELQNDICAVDYQIVGNQVTWSVNWDQYAFDTHRSLPNVTITATKGANGRLIPQQMEVRFREDLQSKVILADAVNIGQGIYQCRSSTSLKSEIDQHLAEGHVLPGIMAKNFLKFIKVDHPLYDVVARYLEGLDFINWLGGKGLIFGKGSVIESSALTDKSTAEAIINRVKAKANFRTVRPQDPISPSHYRARVAQFHYNLLYKYFKDFIETNSPYFNGKIQEIYEWSKAMHEDLDDIPQFINEDLTFGDTEKEDLARCLASLVNQTTFLHWSIHSRQTLLTNLKTTSLCMQNFGLTAAGNELAPYGNTTVEDATLQLRIARTLMSFKSKKFGDYAHPSLLKLVEANKESYAPYDPINEMFTTVEI